MHELSPRILPVTLGSLILDWLEEHDPRGWGMVVASDAPIEDVLAHLRSLLLVKTEGKNLIFRIWDGRILARICAAMSEETPLLLGPARLVLTRTSEGAGPASTMPRKPGRSPACPSLPVVHVWRTPCRSLPGRARPDSGPQYRLLPVRPGAGCAFAHAAKG